MVVQKAVLSRCLKKKCFGANRFVWCGHEEWNAKVYELTASVSTLFH